MIREKSLVEVNEKSIFYKIKKFFMRIFKKDTYENVQETQQLNSEVKEVQFKKTTSLMEEIRGIDRGEIELLELQQRYKLGEITEEEMTQEQVIALCDLYDRQNDKLRRSNEYRKQKIMEYRNSQMMA